MLPAPKLQETIHHHAVQIADLNLFALKPSAKIGDYDDLSSDRVASITLVRQTSCIRIEIFVQRPLPEPFYRSWKGEGEELVYHLPRVPGAAS